MLLSDAISCFLLLAAAERRLAARTVTLYGESLARLQTYASAHARERLADFTPNLVRGAAAAEMEEGSAHNWQGGRSMAATLVSASKTMVKRLREEYPNLQLPDLSVVRSPKIPKRIQPRLMDGEFAQLEAALRMRLLRDRVPRFLIARDSAILEVLANTGLRANECCGLDIDDVDLTEGALRIRKGKGNKERILTIVDPEDTRSGGEVVRALDDYLRYRERLFGPGRSKALWLTIRGNRMSTNALRLALARLCDEAGIDGNRPPHAFRRAHFTEHYRAQPTAMPILMERMGWETEQMARIYTRGVELEMARNIPMPLLSKQWRQDSPKVRSPSRPLRSMIETGAPAGPTLGRTDPNRRASASTRRHSQP